MPFGAKLRNSGAIRVALRRIEEEDRRNVIDEQALDLRVGALADGLIEGRERQMLRGVHLRRYVAVDVVAVGRNRRTQPLRGVVGVAARDPGIEADVELAAEEDAAVLRDGVELRIGKRLGLHVDADGAPHLLHLHRRRCARFAPLRVYAEQREALPVLDAHAARAELPAVGIQDRARARRIVWLRFDRRIVGPVERREIADRRRSPSPYLLSRMIASRSVA